MNNMSLVFENDEKIIFRLRKLYSDYGYMKYSMSKFEEYDLYVRNKDFLISENIITFTDVDGKLMALKPDVTLSIIKNSNQSNGGVQKMYYNENVYRASTDTCAFKEIMQTGLEAIGDIDDYCICEVVCLAAKSLECITDDYILDISHMGIVSQAIEGTDASPKGKAALIKALGEKNVGGITRVCAEEGIDVETSDFLRKLVTLYGTPAKVIDELKSMPQSVQFADAIAQLESINEMLTMNGCADKIRIDFSVINDMKYYNGVVFKGFVNGVPEGVLSGGQYDNLMRKMSRKNGAIGFAVYLDLLERIYEDNQDYDVDTLLLYDDTSDICDINTALKGIVAGGRSVIAQKVKPDKIRYRRLVKLQGTEVEELEVNA